MVKIVDIEEKPDVSSEDDDCIEIDPAEFVKKLNLKKTDDVILVAAKGKIVKVEVDHPEGVAKALYGSVSEADHKHVAAGDCIDNPCEIDDDEVNLLKVVEIDMDRFVVDKPSAKLHGKLVVKLEPVDNIGVEVIPDKLVAKCEPVGDNGVESADEEGSYDHCLDISSNRRIFDEEDEEDVVVV